jgi:hypothetical protein
MTYNNFRNFFRRFYSAIEECAASTCPFATEMIEATNFILSFESGNA